MTTSITNNNAYEVETFIGLCPYSVTIDDTPELRALISEAEKCQDLPFGEKLNAVQNIAMKSMINAYENKHTSIDSIRPNDEGNFFALFSKCTDIVDYINPLGVALRAGAGCCRYQSTLFLILGAAAKLGDKHYLQSTPIHSRLDTCYNAVIHEGKVHHVSIFTATIKNRQYDYTARLGSGIFEKPIQNVPNQPFLAYSTDKDGTVHKYVREGRHFDS